MCKILYHNSIVLEKLAKFFSGDTFFGAPGTIHSVWKTHTAQCNQQQTNSVYKSTSNIYFNIIHI